MGIYTQLYRTECWSCGTWHNNNHANCPRCNEPNEDFNPVWKNINISNNANTVVHNMITPGHGKTLAAIYTVPSGYTFYMTSITYGSGTSAKDISVELHIRDNNVANAAWNVLYTAAFIAGSESLTFDPPSPIGSRFDIDVHAQSAGAGADVHAHVHGYIR